MKTTFDVNSPIYKQIIQEIKKMIVRGEVEAGEKLLSQRKLGRQINVNPNTVQRAYREMERSGIVKTKRGRGTFVVNDENVIDDLKREMIREIVLGFLNEIAALNPDPEKIIGELKNELKNMSCEVNSESEEKNIFDEILKSLFRRSNSER